MSNVIYSIQTDENIVQNSKNMSVSQDYNWVLFLAKLPRILISFSGFFGYFKAKNNMYLTLLSVLCYHSMTFKTEYLLSPGET